LCKREKDKLVKLVKLKWRQENCRKLMEETVLENVRDK
jgi:hypothetical protein